jgi:hypothetical protein
VQDKRSDTDIRTKKLEDDVTELKNSHIKILDAIQANTDITQPIADMVEAAKWLFKTIGWIGKWGRKVIIWVGPVAAGISAVYLLGQEIMKATHK